MKKITATLLGLFGLVICVNAQGTFIVDSSANGGNGSGPTATSGGLVWIVSGGATNLDTSTDISLQIL